MLGTASEETSPNLRTVGNEMPPGSGSGCMTPTRDNVRESCRRDTEQKDPDTKGLCWALPHL